MHSCKKKTSFYSERLTAANSLMDWTLLSLGSVAHVLFCGYGIDFTSNLSLFLNKTRRVIVYETKVFISLFERAFKMMKNGVYFIVIALLVAELEDLWRHKVDTKWSKISKYGISLQILSFAELMCHQNYTLW